MANRSTGTKENVVINSLAVAPAPVLPAQAPEYDAKRRNNLMNKMLQKIELLTDEAGSSREMMQLATAFGLVVDRKRLEDGERTNEEPQKIESLKATLIAKIQQIQERDGVAARSEFDPS